MLKRLVLAAVAVFAVTAPASAQAVELDRMMGRWYEVARVPNKLQSGCTNGASDWRQQGEGFAVVQTCRKGAAVKEWKAKATVADPGANTRFKMTFFGGLVSQEYKVYAHDVAQGWLVLGASDGKYLWLMSQKPTLPAATRAQAIGKIRQLGFDPARLEFPAPGVS